MEYEGKTSQENDVSDYDPFDSQTLATTNYLCQDIDFFGASESALTSQNEQEAKDDYESQKYSQKFNYNPEMERKSFMGSDMNADIRIKSIDETEIFISKNICSSVVKDAPNILNQCSRYSIEEDPSEQKFSTATLKSNNQDDVYEDYVKNNLFDIYQDQNETENFTPMFNTIDFQKNENNTHLNHNFTKMHEINCVEHVSKLIQNYPTSIAPLIQPIKEKSEDYIISQKSLADKTLVQGKLSHMNEKLKQQLLERIESVKLNNFRKDYTNKKEHVELNNSKTLEHNQKEQSNSNNRNPKDNKTTLTKENYSKPPINISENDQASDKTQILNEKILPIIIMLKKLPGGVDKDGKYNIIMLKNLLSCLQTKKLTTITLNDMTRFINEYSNKVGIENIPIKSNIIDMTDKAIIPSKINDMRNEEVKQIELRNLKISNQTESSNPSKLQMTQRHDNVASINQMSSKINLKPSDMVKYINSIKSQSDPSNSIAFSSFAKSSMLKTVSENQLLSSNKLQNNIFMEKSRIASTSSMSSLHKDGIINTRDIKINKSFGALKDVQDSVASLQTSQQSKKHVEISTNTIMHQNLLEALKMKLKNEGIQNLDIKNNQQLFLMLKKIKGNIKSLKQTKKLKPKANKTVNLTVIPENSEDEFDDLGSNSSVFIKDENENVDQTLQQSMAKIAENNELKYKVSDNKNNYKKMESYSALQQVNKNIESQDSSSQTNQNNYLAESSFSIESLTPMIKNYERSSNSKSKKNLEN